MKLTCTKENLHQGLAITSHIGTKNVHLPILSNVYLKADSGGLKLISTNLEIAITCHVRGRVEQQGEYTVPGKLFFDYVNLLPNENVQIDLLDDALSVACGKAKTKIKGIDTSEFPPIPPVEGGVKYSLPSKALSRALSQVLFAAATNESRPELAGVLLSFHGESAGAGTLVLAATDSYRLGEAIIGVSGGSDEMRQVIIPQRTLLELNRVFGVFKDDVDAGDAVEVELLENQAAFRYAGVEITSRTIDGPYPEYQRIIPTEAKTTVAADKQSFLKAVKAVSLFSKNGLFDVEMKTNVAEQKLTLYATDSQRGENQVEVEAMITGEENSILVNFRYLMDAVNAIGAEKVLCSWIEKNSPLTITAFESADERYRHIVMPIRQ